MTVSKHPITRLLPPNVSNSDIRLKSCGTMLGMKGSNDVMSNEMAWSIGQRPPFTSGGHGNAYVYAHPQGGGSSQSNRHLRARSPVLQQMGQNLPDPSVIRRGAFIQYPLPDKPRNTPLYDAVPSMVVGRVSYVTDTSSIHLLRVGILNIHDEILV